VRPQLAAARGQVRLKQQDDGGEQPEPGQAACGMSVGTASSSSPQSAGARSDAPLRPAASGRDAVQHNSQPEIACFAGVALPDWKVQRLGQVREQPAWFHAVGGMTAPPAEL
jgi:hypothetical protein